MPFQPSNDPFHEISSSEKLFFFQRVFVFHVPARGRDELQTSLSQPSFELLRTVAFVTNCCPHAASEQIFCLVDVVRTAIREAKCYDFSIPIDGQMELESKNATS
jgi:hypothetical protein